MLSPLALCAALLAAGPAAASPPQPGNAFDRLENTLSARAREAKGLSDRQEAWIRLNQIRNHQAMSALLAALPPSRRPTRLLYAASGDHMAPLVACAQDPGTRPFAFVYTEVNPAVRDGIEAFLKLLVREGMATKLTSGPPPPKTPGDYLWTFKLGRHPVTLTLVINPRDPQPGENRLYPAWALAQSDMVMTHDWAGDQQENLRLIWELLLSARRSNLSQVPLMMLEDLERHPYPVDLSFFSPAARTDLPFGHRKALRAEGIPPGIELGQPLYGGGVVLGFDARWWRGLDDTSLLCAFNFLLFNQFDDHRLNVIEGGPDPVLAPILLDWSTGFGYRAIDGQDVRLNRNIKPAMLERLPALAGTLPDALRRRWACRMVLLRCLLELEAGGADVEELFPSARYTRRLGDPSCPFPSALVESAAREAQTHAEDYAAAQGKQAEISAALARLAEGSAYTSAAIPCLPAGTGWPTDRASWRALYLLTIGDLGPAGGPTPPP